MENASCIVKLNLLSSLYGKTVKYDHFHHPVIVWTLLIVLRSKRWSLSIINYVICKNNVDESIILYLGLSQNINRR